jgi:hypothetical protein
MIRLLFLSTALLFSSTGLHARAQEAAACAKCHIEAQTQPSTHMAHALETVAKCRILIQHPVLTANYGRFSYRIERHGNQSTYSVSDGTNTIALPIRWAFGASSAIGQTYVLEKDGDLYESRMSWFRELNGLGPTLGGGNSIPANLDEAVGRLMSQDDKLACFGCHSTNATDRNNLTLDKLRPGVQCSHCHHAAEAHLDAVLHPNSGKPLLPPGFTAPMTMSAEQTSNFCGQCHRTWAEIAMQARPSIANVRFQPYRLTESQCFDPDDARISCLACHDPHKNPSTNPVDYDAKCQACHAGRKPGARACTVAKSRCVTCHMPKIALPGAHFRFTDHRIRIVKPNEPYPG